MICRQQNDGGGSDFKVKDPVTLVFVARCTTNQRIKHQTRTTETGKTGVKPPDQIQPPPSNPNASVDDSMFGHAGLFGFGFR